jgi:hypothetical protein
MHTSDMLELMETLTQEQATTPKKILAHLAK